jgi:hypothetical protein
MLVDLALTPCVRESRLPGDLLRLAAAVIRTSSAKSTSMIVHYNKYNPIDWNLLKYMSKDAGCYNLFCCVHLAAAASSVPRRWLGQGAL